MSFTDEEVRYFAIRLIDVVLEDLLSTTKDAGWHQPNLIQRLIDSKGDLTFGSGDDSADTKMINEMKWIDKKRNPLLPYAKQMFGFLTPLQRTVLILEARYEGLRNDETCRKFTIAEKAKMLDLTISQYQRQKLNGFTNFMLVLKEDINDGAA